MVDSPLATLSLLCIYSAMAVYAAALVTFAIDLSGRGARMHAGAASAVHGARGFQNAMPIRTLNAIRNPLRRERGAPQNRDLARAARVAVGLTVLGFSLHLAATSLRGVAARRVPWANMWEFSLTGTLIIVGVFLLVNARTDVRYLGTFVVGLILVLLGIAAVNYYVPVVPLPPALQSYWLVLHVLVATMATGFFALGFATSCLQLMQDVRERQTPTSNWRLLTFLSAIPSATALDRTAYRTNIIGFILWTFTLIAGAIWADRAWGRYWGWDTKEVWTFIIWVIYAGYLHARATLGWRGRGSAWLAIVGFSAVMFNFGVVNVFFKGLHSYSGL